MVWLRSATRWVVLGLAIGTVAALPAEAQTPRVRADTLRFVVAPDSNQARYLVREQLAGVDLPNDAVGKTAAVTGKLVLDEKGAVVASQSSFTIDMSTLTSDRNMRDNFLRRNTLVTAQFPNAVFTPTEIRGLTLPLPARGEAKLQLVGNLTVKNVTRPVTWDVVANFANGAISGLAQTKFTFEQFTLTKPRVARVLSVEDDIRLEYQFKLVPAPAGS